MRALLIRHPFIDLVLDGKKVWEIRGSRTAIRGTIALVPCGSGTVIGMCDLVDCLGPLSAGGFRKNAAKAGMRPSEAKLGRYQETFAWVLKSPQHLTEPVSYKHPSGAVIWVTLNSRVEKKIRDRLHSSSPERQISQASGRGSFAIGDIVSLEYDDSNPDRYEPGTFIGMVVRKEGFRMKVIYAYPHGETDLVWLIQHDKKVPNRWINKSYAAIVNVEEASPAQREAFQRWVPPARQAALLESEPQN